MGFFDAIGKAINDSMSNDEKLGKKQNPGFRVICLHLLTTTLQTLTHVRYAGRV